MRYSFGEYMVAPQERSRTHELNPRIISPEAVQAVVKDFANTNNIYEGTLYDKRVKGTSIEEVIGADFQLFGIGLFGFDLPVRAEDKERFGININSISTLGLGDGSEAGIDDTIPLVNEFATL